MSVNAQKYKMLKRKHKKAILFNEYEMNAFNRYCKKFKISNQSQLIREALFSKVIQGFEDNYPTLFSNEELKKLENYS